jgi:hypothetical protein
MILIEETEFRPALSDFYRTIFYSRSFELGCRSMHRFDGPRAAHYMEELGIQRRA